ncbi:hypothetical protein NO1_1142 [Candidatus Termititenax aidoneus]|uniref:Teneurin-like YD-shell domain-containing protein n=1 Tax=Termititenax aidoneus TaxID=2218524 RepID=A0A388TBQ8_TERA1|nr:hypothetical protein NO1_1142 [Candidatus Termititenax aidoneus]
MKITKYEYTQDIHERLERQVYGNGAITQYGYDSHDRINSIEARTREGQNIFKQEYRYDELGNRAETQWSVEDMKMQSARYKYDTQYQLTGVEYSDLNRKPYIYRYDDNGNRTYFSNDHGAEYYAYEQYDRLIQRYTNSNAKTLYRYDSRGNLTQKEIHNPNGITETTDYDFDIQDRLRSIKHNSQTRAEYEYDSRGMRTRSVQHRIDKRPDPFALFAASDTERSILRIRWRSVRSDQYYWYGAGTEVLLDTDDKGNTTGLYIMAGGRKVASVAIVPDGERSRTVRATGRNTEQLRYYHTDALGSVTAITDGDGKIIEANIYGPFGETEFSYKATLHKVNPEKRAELLVDPFLYSSDNRYTYTGQEQDEFGGLIYYNARWYDAEVGRFISEDHAAAVPMNPLTINRYIYCLNNPLIYVDPTGMWSIGAKIFGFGFSIGDQGMSVSIPFMTIGVNFSDMSMYGFVGLDLSSEINIGVASIGYTAKTGVQVDKHGTYGTASASVYASACGAVASFGAHYASLDGRINISRGLDYNLDLGDLTPDMTTVEPVSPIEENSLAMGALVDEYKNSVDPFYESSKVTPGMSPEQARQKGYDAIENSPKNLIDGTMLLIAPYKSRIPTSKNQDRIERAIEIIERGYDIYKIYQKNKQQKKQKDETAVIV